MSDSTGAGTLSNTLLNLLISGKDFSFPEIDLESEIFDLPEESGSLFEEVQPLSIDELTTGQVDGEGVFDRLMTSIVAHLKVEYEANRISGAEYTKAYIEAVGAALQAAAQFLLAKDQAYWQSMLVQKQAQIANVEAAKARIDFNTAKVELAKAQADAATSEANYGLTKIRIAVEDAQYGNLVKQGEGIDYTNENILPKQEILIREQGEAQRAQTSDVRSDNGVVRGLIGKQKDLYTQQITSYQRDAETKFTKMLADAWITQKTVDEGLLAPDQFTNSNVNAVLENLRSKLGLDE